MARNWEPSRTLDRDLHEQLVDTRVRYADPIAQRARDLAPVGDPAVDPSSGDYRDSIHTEVTETNDGQQVSVIADDPKAAWIEYGNSKITARAVLRRAARQA